MPSSSNYFSNRTTILDIASDVGAAPVRKIQKLFLLKVRESEIKTWPASGDNTFAVGAKGQLSLSVANTASREFYSDLRIQDPANTKLPIGISVPPAGTLGYFAKDEVPNGWIELGDDNKFFPHKVVIGWIDKANAIARYANTEFTEIYDILDSWGLIQSVSKDNLGMSFNTFDPFRGKFIRSLNPNCYGPDANNQPLSTANTSLSLHTHNGFNFPTSKFPVNRYYASASYSGSFSSYNFELDKTEDIVNGVVVNTINHAPRIATPTVISWGDTIILEMNYAAYPGVATPFSIGKYDYFGNMKSISNNVFETNDISFEVNGTVLNNYTDYYNEFLKPGRNFARITFSPKEISGDYYIFNSDSAIPIVPIEIRSNENNTIIDKGRSPIFNETYDPNYANRRGATYPNPFKLGTDFFYNYQYRTGSTWSTLNEGSYKANNINIIDPPFTIRDRQNRIHSVSNFDNHIHTRIKTYYRSVLDSTKLDPISDNITDDTTSLFGYANIVYDASTATDESEWAISQYQVGFGKTTAAAEFAKVNKDLTVSPPVLSVNPAGGIRYSRVAISAAGKLGVTYKNPFYADAMTDPALIKYTGYYKSAPDTKQVSQRHTRTSHHYGTYWGATQSQHHKVTNAEKTYNVSATGFQVFSTEVPSGGTFTPWHILKADANSSFDNHEFYNTGFDGNYALRTTFEGNHRHSYMIANTHYRGDEEFRPINIALRLCIKY